MQKYPPLLQENGNARQTEEKQEGEVASANVPNCTGRPAERRTELGGWTCALCIVGSFFLVYSAFYGVMANLVLYLVTVWGESNASAANTVTTLMGTTFLCSFIGAFASDAYLGRLWGSIIFSILSFVSFCLCAISSSIISKAELSGGMKTFMLCSLYFMGLATGSFCPNISSLGADQLHSHHAKAKLFTLVAMTVSLGQIMATTVVTYVDNKGKWLAGFWLIATVCGMGTLLVVGVAARCCWFLPGGNPLVHVLQVLVVAIRRRNLPSPSDPSFLHEVHGQLSSIESIPGCLKLQHTHSLRCLDKAATLHPYESALHRWNPWQLCTVTQVEEVKCLLKVVPVGLASTCTAAVAAQLNTLFEEQALVTNTKITSWLSIPPASMHVFSIGGSVITGVLHTMGGMSILFWCINKGKSSKATSLQVQGVAMAVSLLNMVVAALVEAYRLSAAKEGYIISVLWLIPQNFLVGVASNFIYSGSLDFFYSEVSDGMRTISSAVSLLFLGSGNYLSTILVLFINYITSTGGDSGWISGDLDQGHLDYFYWFLAAFLTCSFAVYLIYAHFYTYRQASHHDMDDINH